MEWLRHKERYSSSLIGSNSETTSSGVTSRFCFRLCIIDHAIQRALSTSVISSRSSVKRSNNSRRFYYSWKYKILTAWIASISLSQSCCFCALNCSLFSRFNSFHSYVINTEYRKYRASFLNGIRTDHQIVFHGGNTLFKHIRSFILPKVRIFAYSLLGKCIGR